MSYLLTALFVSLSVLVLAKGDCSIPTLVYDDLKCIPKYGGENKDCATEYDCSHIHDRASGTCHLKGKFYKVGESPSEEDMAGRCDHARCTCGEGGKFNCIVPSDTCAEFWVPEFVQKSCYLKYEMNRCCSSGQICAPYDGIEKCEVNGNTYNESTRFDHPTQKCTRCVCDKGFNGKLEVPFCQRLNCTAELIHSKKVDDFCAPYYAKPDSCCPSSWVCPTGAGTYIPASPPPTTDLKCTFGEKTLYIGEKYDDQDLRNGKFSCTCVVPPFLTCVKVTS